MKQLDASENLSCIGKSFSDTTRAIQFGEYIDRITQAQSAFVSAQSSYTQAYIIYFPGKTVFLSRKLKGNNIFYIVL